MPKMKYYKQLFYDSASLASFIARSAQWFRMSGTAIASQYAPIVGGPSAKRLSHALPLRLINLLSDAISRPSRKGSGRISPRSNRLRTSGSSMREKSRNGPEQLMTQSAETSWLLLDRGSRTVVKILPLLTTKLSTRPLHTRNFPSRSNSRIVLAFAGASR